MLRSALGPFWPLFLLACLSLASFPVAAQPSESVVAEWQALNGRVIEAYNAGDYQAGLKWAQQAYEFAEREFGPKHGKTLASMNNLAGLYLSQDRYGEAEPLFEQALQLSREVLGLKHPDTLFSMDILALLYKIQGRYGDAEPLHEQALQLRREVLGPRHPDTLTSMNNLAGLYARQGRYGDAEPLHEQALQLSREVLGPRHPDTLGRMNNLAALYHSQGRYGDAEPLLGEALQLNQEVLGPKHPQTLASMNNLALLYKIQGRYGEAEPLYQQALQLNREMHGPRHPDTLRSMSNLALLYESQGRYGEAEPFFMQALQLGREVLGPRHPNTINSMNNLGGLYLSQGRTREAAPLFEQALQFRQDTLGSKHPDTLISMNNLALLYVRRGHTGEAEQLYKQVLELRREVLGPNHPESLAGMNNLASLYESQGRIGEAEQLYEEALQLRQELLGPKNPRTLASMNNLAGLYESQGRIGEAEQLHGQALQLRQEVLGPKHPDTLTSMNNLAILYHRWGHTDEAEPLHGQALQLRREVLGPRHPDTLQSMNNLAVLYRSLGRYGKAEALFEQVLQLRLEVLGPKHPDTLATHLLYAVALVNLEQVPAALRQLRQMEPRLLARTGSELYSTEQARVRRQLLASQSDFQDVVFSLALREGIVAAVGLAGDILVRWKQIQGEEEAYLARLVRQSQDPRVQALGQEIADLRARLANLARGGQSEAAVAVLGELEAKELALSQVSREYQQRLQVFSTNVDFLRSALPSDSALIELRRYHPFDFTAGSFGAARWAGLLLVGFEDPLFLDLGPVAEIAARLEELLEGDDPAAAERSALRLYERLFEGFEERIKDLGTVYLAVDGLLNLVPYDRLRLPDGRYWAERQALRILQTGRDLLRPASSVAPGGLVALGGIDFDVVAGTGLTETSDTTMRAAHARTRAEIGGFKALPGTAEEVDEIERLYKRLRPGEPVTVWRDQEAREARLKALASPPRVLHLATHGFYLSSEGAAERPMLLSGLSLAGANNAFEGQLDDDGEDGILYSLEVLGLNLEGTELVVLSACDTGKGSLDYSEGVYGLVRALRIAGARQVLMTLRPVDDLQARDFMVAFYKTWLQQPLSDPATALRQTKLGYLTHSTPSLQNPNAWAPYVLVGGN